MQTDDATTWRHSAAYAVPDSPADPEAAALELIVDTDRRARPRRDSGGVAGVHCGPGC